MLRLYSRHETIASDSLTCGYLIFIVHSTRLFNRKHVIETRGRTNLGEVSSRGKNEKEALLGLTMAFAPTPKFLKPGKLDYQVVKAINHHDKLGVLFYRCNSFQIK